MIALAMAVLVAAASPPTLQAQVGQISGTVTDAETGESLSSVSVSVAGTGLSAISGADGAFTLANVPAGTHTIEASRLGFQVARIENVSVSAGATATTNIALNRQVLALQGIVATGLVDPVEGVRSPISVGRVSRDQMPVMAAGSAVENLQGRIPGVRMARLSGQPGEGVTMMLRTPTSFRGSGSPMVVVDGVILGQTLGSSGFQGNPFGDFDANTVGIDGEDIESIEVIRGAAAASLYGSRAAAGVISITTARGQALEQGQTRFSARSEFGITQAFSSDDLASHHWFLVDDPNNPTTYVDADGNPITRAERNDHAPPNHLRFQDRPYVDPIFDNVGTIFSPGNFQAHNFSVAQNTASTNFAVSLNRNVERGAVEGNDGYNRNAFRVNLDHRFVDVMSLGVSMYHARDYRDNFVGAFFGPGLLAPRDVDLSRRDEDGNFAQQPDPTEQSDFQNPLWTQATRDSNTEGARTMASTNLRWDPYRWITASGAVSYDRRDQQTRTYVPKGIPANLDATDFEDGSIQFNNLMTETWNAEAQVSLRRDFGRLNARTTFRSLFERDATELGMRRGENFIVPGIPRVENTLQEDQTGSAAEREVRASGYLVDVAFDYDAKYILTVLGRRDGSSLFGVDNRWHNYYRVAGAWRLGQEDWFNIPNVSEFKISVARGTAGGRPGWRHQYETFDQDSDGNLVRATLGNRNLRPEHTTENEVSLEMILYDRFGVEVTHARQTTTDQLTDAELPGFVGFPRQWINQGAVSGHTTEVSVEGVIMSRPNFNWSSIVIGDRSNSRITEWDIPCYQANWRLFCEGTSIYSLHGNLLLTSLDQLETHAGGVLMPFIDQFQVNDEGYVVWVGDSDYTDGMVDGEVTPGTWGTSAPFSGEVGGVGIGTLNWGEPFFLRDDGGTVERTEIGRSNPLNLGWMNNIRWGAFSFHTHLHASVGADANNRWFQTMTQQASLNTPYQDQAGKPDGLKKPFSYYDAAVGSGGSNYVVEDASYLKLRTLSVNYRLSQSQMQSLRLTGLGIETFQVGLVGRNIFTLSSFSGFDPEQSLNLRDRQNVGGAGYPSTRTFTAEVSVTF